MGGRAQSSNHQTRALELFHMQTKALLLAAHGDRRACTPGKPSLRLEVLVARLSADTVRQSASPKPSTNIGVVSEIASTGRSGELISLVSTPSKCLWPVPRPCAAPVSTPLAPAWLAASMGPIQRRRSMVPSALPASDRAPDAEANSPGEASKGFSWQVNLWLLPAAYGLCSEPEKQVCARASCVWLSRRLVPMVGMARVRCETREVCSAFWSSTI